MNTLILPDEKPKTDLYETKMAEIEVKKLTDEDLVEQLKNLFLRERRIGDDILLNLQEMNSRRLYAKLGFSSLFEFLVKYFHLSESSAYQRISALKLMQSVPEAQTALFKGETNLSTIAATQSFIRKLESEKGEALSFEEKKDIFEAVKGKTHKEALTTFAEMNPVAALPETKEKAITPTHTLLQVTVDQETLSLLQEVKNLLSHEIPDGNLNKVLKRMSEVSVETLKKRKGRNTPKEVHSADYSDAVRKNQRASQKTEMNSKSAKQCEMRTRNIPVETRRHVFQRANNCCEFIGTNGNPCKSRFQLELDHLVPWSKGGSNNESNLKLHCRVHNAYRTKETHGFWWSPS